MSEQQVVLVQERVTLWELASRPPYPASIISKPPTGGNKILNAYVSAEGNLVLEYSDIPKGE